MVWLKSRLNLVYIYGESLERTYFDNDAFPNLTPELGALKNDIEAEALPSKGANSGIPHWEATIPAIV
jgi:hypothetical protein